MKISMGLHLREGAWGGGNAVAHALRSAFLADGHEVIFDLAAPDIDLILLFDPRRHAMSAPFQDRAIFRYLMRVNTSALVVHRVNECDARKGTTGVDQQIRRGNLAADATVFVSRWLKDYHETHGMRPAGPVVIHNGSDTEIFHADGHQPWDGTGKLRIVSHHWSANYLKGFDVYQRLDDLLGQAPYRDLFSYTYMGNLPEGFAFNNTQHVPPQAGVAMADVLRGAHIYLTASRNEPGSNHQNEGALCGLPLLYLENASMPEYGSGYGVGFSLEDFEQKLLHMRDAYAEIQPRMSGYPFTAQRMAADYLRLFKDLLAQRETLLDQRKRTRLLAWLWQQTRHEALLGRMAGRVLRLP